MAFPKIDWDDVFAYSTSKIVRIRHRFLGAFYYLAMLVIVAVIFGYYVAYMKGYYEYIAPTGDVEASVTQPVKPLQNVSSVAYCNNSTFNNLHRPYETVDDQHFAFKSESGTVIGPDGNLCGGNTSKRPCVSWTAAETSISQPSSVLVGTHIEESMWKVNDKCSRYSYGCQEWMPVGMPQLLYVGDVENYVINVEHALTPIHWDDGSEFVATPLKRNFVVIRGDATSVNTRVVGTIDRIPLHSLLKASGISLDACAPDSVEVTSNRSHSYRDVGLSILSTIRYHNPTRRRTVHSYIVKNAPMSASFTREERINATHKRQYVISGVRISFQVGGLFRRFNFKVLLITLVSGFALTAAATTFTDFLLCYVMRHREDYKLFKFEVTPDFDPDDNFEKMVLDKVVEEAGTRGEGREEGG
ncbi:hypothetical protein CYMTET_12355 [Cymbomonas tetramitiformis]|uniref:Uncharacterized protein n=1 Tax=Cymbomonas tetramitiformis TaxID=36881 RepID=A0AAE0GK83_9CHLO|nr:hypothetical protein CYMTET_12355 [Cymbomonas tetramitiformis]